MSADRRSRYVALLDTCFAVIPVPVFHRDGEARFIRCNEAFCAMCNLSEENMLGRTITEVISLEPLLDAVSIADAGLESLPAELFKKEFSLNKNGFIRNYVLNAGRVNGNGSDNSDSFCSIIDLGVEGKPTSHSDQIMRLKDAILAINNSVMTVRSLDGLFDIILEKLLAAVDHADVGCVLLMDENRLLRIASAIGYPKMESKDFRVRLEDTFQWKESNCEPSETLIINDLQEFMRSRGMPDTLLKDDKGRVIRSTMSTPMIVDGQYYGLLNLDSSKNDVFDDVDRALVEIVRSQVPVAIGMFKAFEQTTYESEHDKLTGLFNRRYFDGVFALVQSKALRYKEDFLVVVFDLDGLKKVNDTIGHQAGDRLIRFFAEEMKACIRASDIFARYGGDEFIALVFNADPKGCQARLEEKRLHILEMPISYLDITLSCSFSYGISRFGVDGTLYENLVSAADQRMYDDKARRKAARGA